jgi:type VI secretion system protein ImpK
LKQLLSPYEQQKRLTVDESGGRTVITLTGADELFASGSAVMNDAYADTVKRVASALNQVPGRVTVVGHTDDQPLRSFRYRDNYELSRERAASVASVLRQTIDNPARLAIDGAGSSRPRFRPETDPANRAKNRRVEIVHTRG